MRGRVQPRGHPSYIYIEEGETHCLFESCSSLNKDTGNIGLERLLPPVKAWRPIDLILPWRCSVALSNTGRSLHAATVRIVVHRSHSSKHKITIAMLLKPTCSGLKSSTFSVQHPQVSMFARIVERAVPVHRYHSSTCQNLNIVDDDECCLRSNAGPH